MSFSVNQINFMKNIGISVSSFQEPSDSDIEQIERAISEHLQKKGFDANYTVTKDGAVCESILDIL